MERISGISGGREGGQGLLGNAALESSYDKYNGWRDESIIENTVWAMMLGIEMKLFDADGNLIMDTDKAIEHFRLL